MERYLAERSAHVAEALPGPEAARRLSEMTDEAVRVLARAASPQLKERWALVALGGWGAGALQPRSDLDILVLSEASEGRLKPFVEAVLYPLWDAGLKVGHQVRSPKQQLRAMREDPKTLTAALTARPLAGDVDWAATAADSWVADLNRRSGRTAAGVVSRARPGSPYLLQPDLKEGRGGRRDFDELVWLAAVLSGRRAADPGALVDLGHLSPAEYRELLDAAATVATARWELQRAGHGDTMSADGVLDLCVDAEQVQAALGCTALVLDRVRARIGGGRASHSTAAGDAPLSGDDVVSLVLGNGTNAVSVLERAAQAGHLEHLLPGIRDLMSCRRPGLGHEYTVGAHSIRAGSLVTHPPSEDRALARSLEATSEPSVAVVAALAHDAGKAEGGAGHAERGMAGARAAALRFGLSEKSAGDVAELVGLHLLLVETALRDDLDDEDAVLRCAARIGRRELLAPLHLLTAADSRATGPATWTSWTASLVGTLVSRLDAALSPEVDGAGLAARGEAVRQATLAFMTSATEAERAFVSGAPLRYLASREPAAVARHARLVAELERSAAGVEALIEVSAGPAEGTHSVTVVAPDRPHLLARVAGAMALAGLDILSVDAHGGPHTALDTFVVTSATAQPASPETFAKLERLVRAALRDRLELATRLAERRRHYPTRAKGPVRVETVREGWATALRVTAPDRPGLLYDVAKAVADTALDIRWAKVQTVDGVAKDVFHIVGPDGGPVDEAGDLGHLAMRVRAAL